MQFYQLIDRLDTLIRAWAKHPGLIVTYLAQLNYQLAKYAGNDIVYRNCLTTLGWTYFMQNKLQLARHYYQKALHLYELRSKPKRIIGSIRLKLGEISEREGDDEIAIAVYNTVLVLAQEISNLQLAGDAKIGLGRIYYTSGDINRAFNLFQEGLKLSQENNDPRGEETALGNLGLIYHFLGDLDQAAECHRQAVAISQDIDHKSATGRHLNHLGNVLLEQGKLSDAEDCFQKALTVTRKAKDPLTEQQSLGNLGNLQQAYAERAVEQCSKQDWLTKAEKHHNAALKIANNLGALQDQAKHQTNLGRVYYEQGRFEKAQGYYEQALALAKDQNLDDTLWRIHFYFGNLYAAQDQFELAFKQYEEAIGYIEEQRTLFRAEHRAITFLQEKATVYKDMVLCCLRLGKLWRGLEYTERTKARYLSDLLVKPAKISDNTSSIIQSTLQNLSPHTAVVVFNVTKTGTVVFIAAKQFTTKTVPLHNGWQVSANGQIWARQINTFKYRDLQQMLVQLDDEGENIIGGYLGVYHDMNNEEQVEWQESVLEPTLTNLYETLLVPVHEQLTHLSTQKVIFIPNLGLSTLPLHACYKQSNNNTRDYFLDHYQEIAYAPNFYMLYHSQRQGDRKPATNPSLLAIANPNPEDPLPWAEIEVDSISRFFSLDQVKILDDGLTQSSTSDNGSTQPATVETVKKDSPDYSLIHFACHGKFDLIEPLQSKLYLVPPDELTLDIILEDLIKKLSDTHLIVMSACETGMIDPTDLADEYIGLPAGFLLAGAPRVISTLWAVDDLSTALLMGRFYHNHFKEKMLPVAALRQAQLWLRDKLTLAELKEQNTRMLSHDPFVFKELEQERRRLLAELNGDESARPFAHPYYWAAFTFTGA